MSDVERGLLLVAGWMNKCALEMHFQEWWALKVPKNPEKMDVVPSMGDFPVD